MNCCVRPCAMEALAGVSAIETSAGGVTVSTAELLVILPEVAVIEDVPLATPVASPAVLMVATAGVPEFQAAVAVRFCVLPSL